MTGVILLGSCYPEADGASLLVLAEKDATRETQLLHQQERYYPPQQWVKTVWQDKVFTGFIGHVDTGISPERSPASEPRLYQTARLSTLCQQVDAAIAIGLPAASVLCQGCQLPTLTIFVTREQLQPLLNDTEGGPVAMIYRETAPAQNLPLIRALMPEAKRVGVFVSNQTLGIATLRQVAEQQGLTLVLLPAAQEQEAVRVLRQHIDELDALLVLPELRIVNQWSLKPILLMSARHRVPTFGGITEHYVKAGVMAAVIPDPDKLGTQLVTLVREVLKGETPIPRYPEAVQVAVNVAVAEALGINLDTLDARWGPLLRFPLLYRHASD